MYFMKRNSDYKSICSVVRMYRYFTRQKWYIKFNIEFECLRTYVRSNFYVLSFSIARKNYYDVLNLNRNCSDKDIKEAFIQMSKEVCLRSRLTEMSTVIQYLTTFFQGEWIFGHNLFHVWTSLRRLSDQTFYFTNFIIKPSQTNWK